ncbi:multi-sensor signal transduction histidine kinase [Actinoplanes sp. SE50]|uniref:SpoIIE family protein phosphatase n=1 Tax=unclassified Actinoplanes TaxID=2626549 RepID=UPI00023EBE3F|nr:MULTISPECIES: SpoIIE family protein phosphatase [unclassified Actinoplanes]AEV88106.1 multi-sensor signal transduction histidine kinase [Actinoplanes sp. SE50/110]ATO86511.1 multi-sensor signal transduction histidine kinase [Actinoplanes sp. SE50]SLM03928.1 signal transduction histidine kinase [Actinoplanes sp. SE50/110]
MGVLPARLRVAFERGGEMGRRMAELDWSASPAGDPARWPDELVGAVVTMLASRTQILIAWGPQHTVLYNDAYAAIAGGKHPAYLGRPGRDMWAETWDTVQRLIRRVHESDEAFYADDHPFLIERHGFLEQTYFDVSFDPIRSADGSVGGIMCIVAETTGRVLGERRVRILGALGRRLADLAVPAALAAEAVAALRVGSLDVPYAEVVLDAAGAHPAIRDVITTGRPGRVPLAELADVAPDAADEALVLPIGVGADTVGALVAGVNRHLRLDDGYRDFLTLAAAAIARAVAGARAVYAAADTDDVLAAPFATGQVTDRVRAGLEFGRVRRATVNGLRGLVDAAVALSSVTGIAEVLDVAARHVQAMTAAGRVVVCVPDARAERDGGAEADAEPDVLVPLPDTAGVQLGELRVWSGADGPVPPVVLTQLARLIGLRLANARLYETEHRIARTLQHSLLPQSLPRVPGAVVASRYVAGSSEARVGGDWYDVIADPDGGLCLVIGDVVGKGVQAAAAMGQLRNALRAYLLEGFDCGAALSRLNRLVDTLGRRQFATVFCLRFDPITRVARYSAAGHPSPIRVTGGELGSFLYRTALGPPIGALREVAYPAHEVRLALGDRLLLYTDGLVEDRRQGIDAGLAELTADVARPAEHIEDLLDTLLAKAARQVRRDDIALIALQVTEPTEFVMRLPADPTRLSVLRQRLEDFLTAHAVPDADQFDLTVAVSEAAANAIEHPVEPAEPVITVEASMQPDAIVVIVRDTGQWRPATDAGFRGRGLALIGALTELSVHRSPAGTAVTLRRPLTAA